MALVAGCSEEPGSPTPSGGAGQTSQTAPGQPANGLPHSGAPKVDNPIDTTQWESDPCAVTTEDQVGSAGFPTPEIEPDPDSPGGPSCRWLWENELSSAGGTFFTGVKEGLSHFYARHKVGKTKVLEPLAPIEGHPAVIALTDDTRANGECTVDVGLRDDLLYTVQMNADSDSRWYEDPCKAAQELATLAVQTMKGGA